jgi:hypothetical protein
MVIDDYVPARFRKTRNLLGRVLSQGRIGIGKKAERRNGVKRIVTESSQSLSSVHFVECHAFAFGARERQHVGGNIDGVQLTARQGRLEFGCNPSRTGREIQHTSWRETRENLANQRLFQRPHCGAAGSLVEARLISLTCT